MPVIISSPYNIPNLNGNDLFTKLLVHSDTTDGSTSVVDSSSGAHAMSMLNGAQHSTSFAKFGASSMRLIGDTSNTIDAVDSADFTLGTQDFAIDVWVYFLDLTASVLASHWTSGAPFSSAWNFVFYNSSFMFNYTTDGDGNTGAPNSFELTVPYVPVINTWYHVAVAREVANLRFFVDGTQAGTTQNIGTHDIWDSTEPVRIGALSVNSEIFTSNTFNGYMDEFRFSVGTPRYTTDFTPPTSPYGS